MSGVRWKNQPDGHDYPAAASYLSLVADSGANVGMCGNRAEL